MLQAQLDRHGSEAEVLDKHALGMSNRLLSQHGQLVEQGHVRVGPEVVTDPAYLVTRGMEDYLTWVDTSKVRRHVLQYNDKLDDFDML